MCVTTADYAKGHGRQRGPGRELASWAAPTRWTPQLSHRGGGGSLQPRQLPPHTHTQGPAQEDRASSRSSSRSPCSRWQLRPQGTCAGFHREGGRAPGERALGRKAEPSEARRPADGPPPLLGPSSMFPFDPWHAGVGGRPSWVSEKKWKNEGTVSGCGHRAVAHVTPGAMSSPARPRPGRCLHCSVFTVPGPGEASNPLLSTPANCSPRAGPARSPQPRLRGWQRGLGACGGQRRRPLRAAETHSAASWA